MLPGVRVHSGGKLHAYISPDGFYCNGPGGLKEFIAGEQVAAESVPGLINDDSFISIYPNPTTGKFNMNFYGISAEKISAVEIYNWLGQRVIKTRISREQPQLPDLSGYPDGIYLLRVFQDNSIRTGKIVLRR
jgi:hypothetical protein